MLRCERLAVTLRLELGVHCPQPLGQVFAVRVVNLAGTHLWRREATWPLVEAKQRQASIGVGHEPPLDPTGRLDVVVWRAEDEVGV